MATALSDSMRERIAGALQVGMTISQIIVAFNVHKSAVARIRNVMEANNGDVTRKTIPGRPAHFVTKEEALKLRDSPQKLLRRATERRLRPEASSSRAWFAPGVSQAWSQEVLSSGRLSSLVKRSEGLNELKCSLTGAKRQGIPPR